MVLYSTITFDSFLETINPNNPKNVGLVCGWVDAACGPVACWGCYAAAGALLLPLDKQYDCRYLHYAIINSL